MNQQEFTADLFIKDEYFQRWVYTPDPQIDLYWKTFLKDNPECQDAADEAKRFLLLFTNQENDVLKSRISNLKGKIDNAIDSQSHNIPLTSAGGEEQIADTKIPQDRSNIIRWAVAASILLLAGASVLFFYPVDSILDISFADHQEQKTQKGQHSVITLEDGTKVWLNADSRLEYPKSFSVKETRQVFLEGEGYFIVTRNVNKPFIVNTSGVSIRVLGTSFNVKSYGDQQNIETTLVEGKVTIKSNKNTTHELTLLPNQHAVFEKTTGELKLEDVNAGKYTGWKEGRLNFEEVPLAEIIVSLERWFNVTIHLPEGAKSNCTFSAKVDNKTLTEVLDLFKESTDMEYEMKGKEVFITGELCNEEE